MTHEPAFPDPWSRDTFLVTLWPGPVTVRYRPIVCRLSWFTFRHIPYRCWQAEDQELARSLRMPVRSRETFYGEVETDRAIMRGLRRVRTLFGHRQTFRWPAGSRGPA